MRRFFVVLSLLTLLSAVTIAPLHSQDTPVNWDGTLRRIHAPILMYHYVSAIPAGADRVRISLTVEPYIFRQQMAYLRDNGYQPISLYDLYGALMQGSPLPANPVVLTFDDSYIDHYTEVFPILREFGYTATFFVITARADANDPAHLNWEQIRTMADAGMSMESHTKNHAELDTRDYDFLLYEILGSLQSLAYYTGRQTHMFCYPVGRYDANTLDFLRTLPIWAAVTTQPGTLHTSDNLLETPRVRISHDTSLATFAYLLQR